MGATRCRYQQCRACPFRTVMGGVSGSAPVRIPMLMRNLSPVPCAVCLCVCQSRVLSGVAHCVYIAHASCSVTANFLLGHCRNQQQGQPLGGGDLGTAADPWQPFVLGGFGRHPHCHPLVRSTSVASTSCPSPCMCPCERRYLETSADTGYGASYDTSYTSGQSS